MLTDLTVAALPVFSQGMALGFALIVAIGAQNAFVLRQGLRREHVGSVVLVCAIADALLITLGVFGMAQALGERVWLARLMAFAGAVFLFAYASLALKRAASPGKLETQARGSALSRGSALAQASAFTFLNPHVYLDTMLLVGTAGAQQPVPLQPWFAGGASAASFIWFFSLGYGARWLAPWFARPSSWRILDGLIGVVMLVLAGLLLRQGLLLL